MLFFFLKPVGVGGFHFSRALLLLHGCGRGGSTVTELGSPDAPSSDMELLDRPFLVTDSYVPSSSLSY